MAAPTIDAVTSIARAYGGSNTFSHTCAGDNRLLLVFTSYNNLYGYADSATYNGVAMTKLGTWAEGNAQCQTTAFYLVAPATGAHNVYIHYTWSMSGNQASTAISFNGVNQDTPLGNSTGAKLGGVTGISGTINTSAGSLVVMGAGANQALTDAAGQTNQAAVNQGTAIYQKVSTKDSGSPTTGLSFTFSSTYTSMNVVDVKGISSNNYTQAVSDSISFSESSILASHLSKAESVSLGSSEAKGFVTAKAESLTLTEGLVKSSQKSWSESLGMELSTAKDIGLTKNETLSLLEALRKGFYTEFAESLTLAEGFVARAAKVFGETLSLDLSTTKEVALTYNEPVSLSGTFRKGFATAFADSLSLADSFLARAAKVFGESVSISEQVAKGLPHRILLSDLLINDSLSKGWGHPIAESLTLADERIVGKVCPENFAIPWGLGPFIIGKVLDQSLSLRDKPLAYTERGKSQMTQVEAVHSGSWGESSHTQIGSSEDVGAVSTWAERSNPNISKGDEEENY